MPRLDDGRPDWRRILLELIEAIDDEDIVHSTPCGVYCEACQKIVFSDHGDGWDHEDNCPYIIAHVALGKRYSVNQPGDSEWPEQSNVE